MKDFVVNRELAKKLEYIVSEFELRRNVYIMQNPTADTKSMDEKLKMLYDIQAYHFEVFELMEQLKKEIQLKDITIKTLQAKNNQLENQQVIK